MDLTYATIPTPNGSTFRLYRELERKYHVEDPRRKDNEILYREVGIGCYEIEATPVTSTKMELNGRTPGICNVWDPMDSFDGLFIEGDLNKTDNGLPHSELKSESNLSVENMLSAQPPSNDSVRCQHKSDGILGPHPPYFSEIGKTKDKLSDENLMEFTRDDKVNIDKVKYTIPNKIYASLLRKN